MTENSNCCGCAKCRRTISNDEIGLSKKLINRGTTTYFCIDCLADSFDVPAKALYEKILYYKEIGCTLFCS